MRSLSVMWPDDLNDVIMPMLFNLVRASIFIQNKYLHLKVSDYLHERVRL